MGTPSSVKRSTDATGDDILTLETGDGAHIQAVVLVDDDGALAVEYATSDVAEDGAVTYVGKTSPSEGWQVIRIDESSGLAIRYAGSANNPDVTSYADAWSGRAGLVYGTIGEAL